MSQSHFCTRRSRLTHLIIMLLSTLILVACGPTQIEFAVKHMSDQTGEQIEEIVSFVESPALDNSSGESPLQVQIEFERNYKHQIIERLNNDELSGQRVRDKIVELYKLPVNDPEGTTKAALCPVSVVIPASQRSSVTVEWTERWAEGLINEGKEGEGDRLGTYRVFLGYIEPCSLINQENIQ